MKNRTIMIMLSAAAAVFFIFVAAVEAQSDCSCSPSESDRGECTRLRDGYGNFTGYIVKQSGFSYNENTQKTTGAYEICVEPGYSPPKMNHVTLELPICTAADGMPIHCIVTDATDPYEVHLNGAGDPSKGFLKWFPSDLLKIKAAVWEFFVTVEGDAYKTLGLVGIKAGKAMLVGKILTPVCDQSCGFNRTFAAATGTEDKPVTVETESGYKFELVCDASTGCCEVTACFKPGEPGIWKEGEQCNKTPFGQFFETKKDGVEKKVTEMSSGEACINLLADDLSPSSPSYCSGGWCWYW